MECPTLAALSSAALARATERHGELPSGGKGPVERWLGAAAELRRREVLVVFLIDDVATTGQGYAAELPAMVSTRPAFEATRILLTGDEKLRRLVADSPLSAHLGASCTLAPLQLDEVAAYVAYRLRSASGRADVAFTRQALELIATYSRGIPRLVNVAADAALFCAFRAGQRRVTRAIVAQAIREALGAEPPSDPA
jgi:general secretion pathway protein A